MTEVQITSWRDIPSLVVVRRDAGSEPIKVMLASRFQEAIDEAAMRLGESGADDYLAGWTRTPWEPAPADAGDDPAAIAESVSAGLEARWNDATLTRYLDSLGPASG